MATGLPNFANLGRTYRITPIQEPTLGAVVGRSPLSRLPLGPSLILQLDTWDKDDELILPTEELEFLVCHLRLQTPDGEDATMIGVDGESQESTCGTMMATPVEMLDRDGNTGIYFVFPDISVRFLGTFRLKAFVMRITGGAALDDCITETFEIVPEEEFVAPPITELTTHFMSQHVANFGQQPMQGGDWFGEY